MWFFQFFRAGWVKNAIEVVVLTFFIYNLLKLMKGTRAMQVLKGLLVFLGLVALAIWFDFMTIVTLVRSFGQAFLLALIIVFQPEIRGGLAQMGQKSLFRGMLPARTAYLDEVIQAATNLAEKHIGGIIVLEREGSLQGYVDTGVPVDAEVSAELLVNLFTPYSPLHDGAVIIRGNRIAAAACLLPLSQRLEMETEFGTRHRAALGLTEEVDAVALVISEERGSISVALDGKMTRDLTEDSLRKTLRSLMGVDGQA